MFAEDLLPAEPREEAKPEQQDSASTTDQTSSSPVPALRPVKLLKAANESKPSDASASPQPSSSPRSGSKNKLLRASKRLASANKVRGKSGQTLTPTPEPDQKEAAQIAGYTVIDPTSVIITHLQELIKAHAHEILCREDVQMLVDNAKKAAPTVVGELIPEQLSLAGVQKVLENLLRERVPISDMPAILETIADYAPLTKDPQLLTEYVRQRMARTITGELIGADNKLNVIIFDQSVEREIVEAGKDSPSGPIVALEPTKAEEILNSISRILEGSLASAFDVVMLTNAASRRFVRSLLETALPSVPVISYDELVPTVNLESIGTVAIGNDA